MTHERKTPEQAKKMMQHGKDWDGRDVAGWYISEKMDGCRAYWDGAHLYTKEGNPIDAPSITDALPRGLHLDGELWAGRGGLQTARILTQYGKNPERVQFVAFDAPGVRGDWPDRLAAAKDAGARVAEFFKAESTEQALSVASALIQQGAEGVMARLDGRAYTPGRSALLLKIKAHSLQMAGFVN
jgi:DNA ligase-1